MGCSGVDDVDVDVVEFGVITGVVAPPAPTATVDVGARWVGAGLCIPPVPTVPTVPTVPAVAVVLLPLCEVVGVGKFRLVGAGEPVSHAASVITKVKAQSNTAGNRFMFMFFSIR